MLPTGLPNEEIRLENRRERPNWGDMPQIIRVPSRLPTRRSRGFQTLFPHREGLSGTFPPISDRGILRFWLRNNHTINEFRVTLGYVTYVTYFFIPVHLNEWLFISDIYFGTCPEWIIYKNEEKAKCRKSTVWYYCIEYNKYEDLIITKYNGRVIIIRFTQTRTVTVRVSESIFANHQKIQERIWDCH